MTNFTKDDLNRAVVPAECWREYRKTRTIFAARIQGPFTVETREGTLTCPDGYLAVDSEGWPYPIARSEFDAIYEEVND